MRLAPPRHPPRTRGRPLSTPTSNAPLAASPGWLARRRAEAAERLVAASWPTEAEEVWRYSGIDGFDPGAFAAGRHAPIDRDASVTAAEGAAAAFGPRAVLVVTRAGQVLGTAPASPVPGLAVRRLADVPDGAAALGSVAGVHDAFGELHDSALADAVVVDVAPGTAVPDPVVVVHLVDVAPAPGAPVHPLRTVVRLGENAEATVLELALPAPGGDGGEALVLPVAELDVADGARLGYLQLQALPPGATHVGLQASRLGRDASLRAFTAGLGGSYARVRTDSVLVGAGGTSTLLAAYLGTGEQVHDFRTLQDHAAPRTDSELLFTGAVADRARSVYTGLIRIRPGAKKADAMQTNRNLVLSEGAHADSVPNLDILENDVRCSHASAVGPIDEEQRFYLESRGIDPATAERLIVLGFFADLARRSPLPSVARYVEGQVAARLGRRLGLEAGAHG